MSKSTKPNTANNFAENKTSEMQKKPNFKISLDLTERQKQFVAVLISIILVSGIFFGFAYYTNTSFRNSFSKEKPKVTTTQIAGDELNESLSNLGQSLSKLNVDEILYDTINLESFPVYPKAWVERYFSLSERQNALISGPGGDPDNDGLSNKQEFYFGSNPRNKDTLCLGKMDKSICKGKSDGENVAAFISPLTGGTITANRSFRVNKQNSSLLTTLEQSFENSSKEGVDFPSLYQLSKEINLDDYLNSFNVVGVDDNRDSFAKYIEVRSSIVQGFVDDSELNSLNEIYGTNDPNQLKVVKDLYQNRLNTLKSAAVPKKYVQTQKAYLAIFSKVVELVSYRLLGVQNDTLNTEEYKNGGKKLAVEVVGGYRKLNEEITALGSK